MMSDDGVTLDKVEQLVYYGLTDAQREFMLKHERLHELMRKPPREQTVIEIYEFLLLCSLYEIEKQGVSE